MIAESTKLAARLHGGLRAALVEGNRRGQRLRRAESGAGCGEQRARLVHAGLRRGVVAADREADQEGSAARADLFAGPDRRAGAVGALRADLGGARHRGLSRPSADRRRHLPVGHRRERGLEAAAAEAGAQGRLLGQAVDAVGSGNGARLHAREGDGRRRRRRSRAASTCRARASRTRKTCSRSKTPRWPTAWRPSSTRSGPATPASRQPERGQTPLQLDWPNGPVSSPAKPPGSERLWRDRHAFGAGSDPVRWRRRRGRRSGGRFRGSGAPA